MVSFSQQPVVNKDTVFGAARNFFGPSYFVTALALFKSYLETIVKTLTLTMGCNILGHPITAFKQHNGTNSFFFVHSSMA